jgi:hypothetical protein
MAAHRESFEREVSDFAWAANKKAPAICGGPRSDCDSKAVLPHARPGPPSVVTEEAEVIGRAKPVADHEVNVEHAIQKVKIEISRASSSPDPITAFSKIVN